MALVYKIDVMRCLYDMGYSNKDLDVLGISYAIRERLQEGAIISWPTLEKLCTIMRCKPGDIMKNEQREIVSTGVYYRPHLTTRTQYIVDSKVLKSVMEKKGITSFSKLRTNFGCSTIGKLSHGSPVVKSTIDKLCNVLGCDISDLRITEVSLKKESDDI